MSRSKPIHEPLSWARVGRGKELQFFATDDDVQNWLQKFLPAEFAPYYLVGSDLEKVAKRTFRQTPFRFHLSEFPTCLCRADKQRFNFWLLSEQLTPDFKLRVGDPISNLCGSNGLVLLQHGLLLK